MAERDKVIKSGQITLPRLLFLAAIGGFVVLAVSLGGWFLVVGYWALTLGICGLLYLIAIDWHVHMDKVELHPTQRGAFPGDGPTPLVASGAASAPSAQSQVKRKGNRPAKRRR